jgi:MFS family permease
VPALPDTTFGRTSGTVESPYAWLRLGMAVLLCTIGGIGMWSVVVALPAVQADFGVARGAASLPYTLTMLGYATGGVFMGRVADRLGVAWPLAGGAIALGLGYAGAGLSTSLWQFTLAHGLAIGFLGGSAAFGPLMADISLWFTRRRGIAVAVCASGNYIAGTIWPPVVQYLIGAWGWRHAHMAIGLFCVTTMLPLALLMRRAPPPQVQSFTGARAGRVQVMEGLSPGGLQWLLSLAAVGCCVAMAMPQVHIVAYCGDLGYGVARGAEMLSLMLGFGVISRLASGFVADRIGGLRTLLLGSVLQMAALAMYLVTNGLTSLYVVSALFGLFQGGIVPSYAIIVREYFPAREAGARVGIVLMASMLGMALGGWMSGAIFDLTGSYRAAFANGVGWNLLNLGIVVMLMRRRGVAVPA